MKKTTAKSLNGEEFELDIYCPYHDKMSKEHNPAILILPVGSFGIGTRLNLDVDINVEDFVEINENVRRNDSSVVTNVYKENGKIIIEAEKGIHKEEKLKFINKIVKKIDVNDALADEIFIKMLSNVFTEEQLNDLLYEDDIEILLFNGLMYLKVKDKVYRL